MNGLLPLSGRRMEPISGPSADSDHQCHLLTVLLFMLSSRAAATLLPIPGWVEVEQCNKFNLMNKVTPDMYTKFRLV